MKPEEGFFGERVAATYDEDSASMFDPAVIEPAVDRLAELAGDGTALEFAVGTGRIALRRHERSRRTVGNRVPGPETSYIGTLPDHVAPARQSLCARSGSTSGAH